MRKTSEDVNVENVNVENVSGEAIIVEDITVFREFLWKFFYPADYQQMKPSVLPEPGQQRIFKEFDFKMSLQADATFDTLFTKNKVSICI